MIEKEEPMRSFWSLVMVLCLVLVGGVSCGSSPSKVEDGDRLVVHHTVQAAALVDAQVQLAISMLVLDLPRVKEALAALREAQPAAADVKLNAVQLNKNFGPPKDPTDYSPSAAAAARGQSEKEHSSKGWLGWLGGGIALALAGLKIAASFVPSIARFFSGPWGAVADTGVAFIDSLKRKGKVDSSDLEELRKLQEDARVQPFVKALAKKFEATGGAPPGPPA